MNKQEKPNQDGATAIPVPDQAAIRSHVELLHTLARSAGVEGILAFTRIDASKTHTEKFAIGDVDHMADAIIGWSTHPDLNIYASYAIFRKDLPPGTPGGEADVRAVLALVGDLDSDVGKKGVGLNGLPMPPPYVVETSADNFHAVYPLGPALPPKDAKPVAVALSDAIGGDSGTKDVSHLWRIPGTLNWPSAKKLGRGRPKTPQLVTIKSAWTGKTVDPDTLRRAATDFEFAKTSSGPSSTGSSSGSSSGSTGSSTETFDDLPADLKKLIAAPGYPGEDRSRTAASVIWKLFRRGWSDDAVQALFEAHPNGVGERYTGGPTGKTDLRKEIERLRQKFNESDVERLNKSHAVLPIGGKTRVVTFGELAEFPGRETIEMTQTIADFKLLNNKYRHTYRDKEGELRNIPLGSYWIGNPLRRQYDEGMAFMPQHNGDVGNRLNLFRGFGVKAIKPDGKSGAEGCQKFLDFMRDIICSGNKAHFDYLLRREATVFQKRIRSEIALGLQTKEEGCGKGFYEATMGRLLGNHAMQVTNPKHIIGNFNPHLETLLRLTADEALFVGNHEHRNALFGLITEPTLTIEPKGCALYKANSYLNLSITSNADHFLPVSGTARRFFIPTVSAARKQDHQHFAGLQAELDNGGYEALLYHLLHEVDLRGFDVRKVPQTEALRQQRNHSLPPLDAWWCELLESGTLYGADRKEPHRAVSNRYQRQIEIETNSSFGGTNTQVRYVTQLGIYDQCREIEPRLKKNYTNDHRLGAHLKEMGCVSGWVLRRRGWAFPPLTKCRAAWEEHYPNWEWRNPELTEWQAEESDVSDEADKMEGDDDPS